MTRLQIFLISGLFFGSTSDCLAVDIQSMMTYCSKQWRLQSAEKKAQRGAYLAFYKQCRNRYYDEHLYNVDHGAAINSPRKAYLHRLRRCSIAWRQAKTQGTKNNNPRQTWPQFLKKCNRRLKSQEP